VWKARSQARTRVLPLVGMEITSSFSMWNHSESGRFDIRYGGGWSGARQPVVTVEEKNCLDQSMPAMAWRITFAASSLTDDGVTDL